MGIIKFLENHIEVLKSPYKWRIIILKSLKTTLMPQLVLEKGLVSLKPLKIALRPQLVLKRTGIIKVFENLIEASISPKKDRNHESI